MKFAVSATIIAAMIAAGVIVTRLASPTPTTALAATRTPSPTASSTRVPTATPPPRPATLEALGPGIMVSECLPDARGAVRAIFLWTPSRAGFQYLDLSIFNNGFAPGTFIGLGALGPTLYGYVWDGLRPATTHYARVNTYTNAGWRESKTLAFYTPRCGASSSSTAAPDMLRLRDAIAGAIGGQQINTAVAITDLRTGETIDVAGDTQRLPGCTINLFALMQVAADLQDGRYPEPEPGDLIGQTINRSDPITARRLVRDWLGGGDLYAGIDRVNNFVAALGMSSTFMDHPPAFPQESRRGMDESNRITALDVNTGLQSLWDGRALSPTWRDYFLDKMTLVKPGLNYLIPSGVSAGATVSHKNGFLYEEGWADNDIGIVWYARSGERYGYAISFFTQNVRGKYDDIPLGQRISSLAYQWFVGRYGYP